TGLLAAGPFALLAAAPFALLAAAPFAYGLRGADLLSHCVSVDIDAGAFGARENLLGARQGGQTRRDTVQHRLALLLLRFDHVPPGGDFGGCARLGPGEDVRMPAAELGHQCGGDVFEVEGPAE